MKVDEIIYQFVTEYYRGDEKILCYVTERVYEELPVFGYSEKDVRDVLRRVGREVEKKFY